MQDFSRLTLGSSHESEMEAFVCVAQEITLADLEKLRPKTEIVDEALRLIKSRERGRPLKLARLLFDLHGNDDIGRCRVCFLGLSILSEWRGARPSGIRRQLLRMAAEAWIRAETEISPTGHTGQSHIGYEFLIEDAIHQREWERAINLAREAEAGGWDGWWSEAAEYARKKCKRIF